MSNQANYTPLSPQSFLRRNARVYPDKTAIIHGDKRYSYLEFFKRCCRQSNGLAGLGIKPGEKVAVLVPNTPPHLEANFGIHMMGGVLVAINTRLSSQEVAFILQHSDVRALIVDYDLLSVIEPIIGEMSGLDQIIVVHEEGENPPWEPEGALDYEKFLAESSDQYPGYFPADENDVISINYTSGTTGNPKGVMYTHRSAYLNGICNILEMNMSAESVYLWTLPMFHCNGWCYTWGVTALGATHVCLRGVNPLLVVETIKREQVTHLCGAPIVLRMLVDGAAEAGISQFSRGLKVATAAAPPSPAIIEAVLNLNADLLHVYGLTETYGPTTVCEIQPDWKNLPRSEMAQLMARQGVPFILSEDLIVLDQDDHPVPSDGETLGEVCMKGNIVAKGYFKNPEATEESFRNGWFHSGDLGVTHPDGYIELKDRSKDIIISGGENISTIEVENTLYRHQDVQDVAVVAKPDEKWGEVPVAFITPKEGKNPTESEIIEFCRNNLAHFKAPKAVFFEKLPRTSTGKVKKFILRERFWGGHDKRVGG